jgi:hypothetical protein
MEELVLIDEQIIIPQESNDDDWDNHVGDNISF